MTELAKHQLNPALAIEKDIRVKREFETTYKIASDLGLDVSLGEGSAISVDANGFQHTITVAKIELGKTQIVSQTKASTKA